MRKKSLCVLTSSGFVVFVSRSISLSSHGFQELLAVSVISFSGVVAQLFVSSRNFLPSSMYFEVSTTTMKEPCLLV